MEQVTKTKIFNLSCITNMPRGTGALFLIQIFSTLAFSVLYSTLVLYTTHSLHLNDTLATGITATFVAFNYALHLIGGYIGGRFLSYRSLFTIGMLATAIGCALLSIPSISYLYWGLAVFLTGAGLNITCINCMLTQLFQPQDKRRETAFLWNYSGMNIGFLIGFSLSGYFQLSHGYERLFLLSSLGSFVAILIIIINWHAMVDTHSSYIKLENRKKFRANVIGILLLIGILFALRVLLEHARLSNSLIMIAGLFMAILIFQLSLKQPRLEQQKKIWGYLILAASSIVFWTLFQLAPMGMTLFIERNVNHHFLGFEMATQWVQNINTIVIIIGGPILSVLFANLRVRGIQFPLALQFSLALLLISLAMFILPIGIHFADAQGYVSFTWILIYFILQSLGELFISPIGYAMIGQLAPPHLQGLMMGNWLMLTGIAATFSAYFSNKVLQTTSMINPAITNASYSHTFLTLGIMSLVTAGLLMLLLPMVTRLTQEKIDLNVLKKWVLQRA